MTEGHINPKVVYTVKRPLKHALSPKSTEKSDVNELLKKVIKLENEAERNRKMIEQLDERAGPALVESQSSDSDMSTMSIPTVTHEVEQKDPGFARNYTYTTNVSNFLSAFKEYSKNLMFRASIISKKKRQSHFCFENC